MASKVSGMIEQINALSGSNNVTHNIASTAYGYCETAAGTAAKVVDMTGFKLVEGVTIHVKFKEKNSASSPTLNVNNTGAKNIVQYGTTAVSTADETSGWYAGAVISFTYDGTSWVRDQGFNTNTWRGIQDNLTSSTNTTESLSAKQGYLLANGSARDNTKLPLAGGQMTGPLTWKDSTALPEASSLSYFLGIDAFASGGTTKWISAANVRTSIGAAASSHTHGNIQNTGTLQTTDVTIGSGDKLVITDSSDSNKVARSSLAFSATISSQTTSSKFLREDGTWSAPSYIANTDTKVTQTINTVTTGTDLYPLLFSYYKTTESTTTEQTVQRDTEIYAQPSIGAIGASKYVVNGKVVLEYNSTDQSLDFIFI